MQGTSTDQSAAPVLSWLHQQGLKGADGGKVLEGLCARLCDIGIEIDRAVVGYLVFHPQFDGMNCTWTRDRGKAEHQAVIMRDILKMPSPFLDMQASEIREMRFHLEGGGSFPYPFLESIHAQSFTDYFAFFGPFGTYVDHTISPDIPKGMRMYEGVTGSFATKQRGGFEPSAFELLRSLAQPISAAVRVGFVLDMAETLLGTYLGKVSRRNVLRGHVRRGQGRIITLSFGTVTCEAQLLLQKQSPSMNI